MCSAKMLFQRPVRVESRITVASGTSRAADSMPEEPQLAARQELGQPWA
jgi:hypothetical protein